MISADLVQAKVVDAREEKQITMRGYLIVKRVFDLLFALLALLPLALLTTIVKIAYICTGDFHSIFYTQERIGKNGKIFKIYKYRSMAPDADEALKKLLAQKKYHKQWQEYQKIDNDPRITKIGKFLRISSIDEFPQFINVLVGHMSVVGPRPLLPGEIDEHNGNAAKYQSVKPGITGYWAMRIRSDNNSDYDERLKLEYFYIENCSLALDLRILLNTIIAVIKRQGAK